jgi:dipeptidyl aminopeptidase/acylaminoacyl peptidase
MRSHRFIRRLPAVLTLAFCLWAHPAQADATACSLPASGSAPTDKRGATADDIARIRDIGINDIGYPYARSLALSPDGSRIAFQVRRAEPETNSYCLAMIILETRQGGRPLVVDQGGVFLTEPTDLWGRAAFPSGNPLPIDPIWSPDGQWIAFLKRVGKVTQVWRAQADGSESTAVTTSDVDVEAFQISADGRSIIYAGRPGLKRALEAIDKEGLTGFKYGDRFSPMVSKRPFPEAPIPTNYVRLEIDTKVERPATAGEAEGLSDPTGTFAGSAGLTANGHGARTWIKAVPDRYPTINELYVQTGGRQIVKCADAACKGRISRPWWSGDGQRLFYFRREGWGNSATAIYQWVPGESHVRRLLLTDDVLAGCTAHADRLYCLREGSAFPRIIVDLDLRNGKSTMLFDPNPEIGALSLGQTERLKWTNPYGIESYADIVYPVGFKAGTRYPLVIVQYESRGFLRGGTGDEYPIQAFANRGYVVLSFARPQSVGLFRNPRDPLDAERINVQDFVDRKSITASLDAAIQTLVQRGIVDSDRIGLTGLSDGVTTIQYELIHGGKFAAVAMSHGSWEAGYPWAVGPAPMKAFKAAGYPGLTEDSTKFWKEFGFRPNADRIRMPILMQVADDEYISILEGFTALREVGAPVQLYIFPDEHHIKWQSAHRLAIYSRSLDWFDYWLKGLRSVDPERQSDIEDWDLMKAQLKSPPPSGAFNTPSQ